MTLDQTSVHQHHVALVRNQRVWIGSPMVKTHVSRTHGLAIMAFVRCCTLCFFFYMSRRGSFHHNGVSSKYTAEKISPIITQDQGFKGHSIYILACMTSSASLAGLWDLSISTLGAVRIMVPEIVAGKRMGQTNVTS